MLVEDGRTWDTNRRDCLFSTEYKFVGVAEGPHKKFKNMVVIDYAAGYTPKEEFEKPEVVLPGWPWNI
jgi:hypothetical protein